jgi:hypothetical protein
MAATSIVALTDSGTPIVIDQGASNFGIQFNSDPLAGISAFNAAGTTRTGFLLFVDGTSGSGGATELFMGVDGTTTSDRVSLGNTNTGHRALIVSGIGAVSIAAPTAATALTVNGASGQNTLIVNAADATECVQFVDTSATSGIRIGVRHATTFIGGFGTGPETFTGAALTDFGITSGTGVLRIGYNNGGNTAIQIGSAGAVVVNAATTGTSLTVTANSSSEAASFVGAGSGAVIAKESTAAARPLDCWNAATTGTGTTNALIDFFTDSGQTFRGGISYNGTTGVVAYATTSDKRLKINIRDSDRAGEILDRIRVRAFDWVHDYAPGVSHSHWLVAQELYEVFPAAVISGDESTPWKVDISAIVPLLVKEVQELRARLASSIACETRAL